MEYRQWEDTVVAYLTVGRHSDPEELILVWISKPG